MLISPIITRLRQKMPWMTFGGRVAGAADYDDVEDNSRLALPAIYVTYAGCTAIDKSLSPVECELDERLLITLILDNNDDRTGKVAQDQVHAIRTAIFSVLFNYVNDNNAYALSFVRDGKIPKDDRSRYFHEFEFKQISIIDYTDGAQEEFDELQKIYTDYNLIESKPINHPDAQDQLTNLYNP